MDHDGWVWVERYVLFIIARPVVVDSLPFRS